MLEFGNEVIQSKLESDDPYEQIQNIVSEFNGENHTIMTKSPLGMRINADEFRLVALNNQPELVPPTNYPLRKKIYMTPGKSTEELGIFKQTALCFGGYGSYVVNIPNGKLGLGWLGKNKPIIIGPGPHVFHDPNFKEITEENLVDLNSAYINHGTYHIIRVPLGHVAKININATAYFLLPNDDPYVFNNPTFKVITPYTKLTNKYITHGNYNILQIPHGKIAKIWINSIPYLLEGQDEPYMFNDPSFVFESKSNDEMFYNSTEKYIVHGSIKRLLPKTGEVAITYENGKLVTIESPLDNQAITINNPNHSFEGFLQTNYQNIEFPSKNTKELRKKEGKSYEEINYEIFRTGDGLPIGVNILVVYEISDPQLTLSKLAPEQITQHIEYIVVADMGMVIQNCNSTNFLKTDQTMAKSFKLKKEIPFDSPFEEFYEHLQDKVKNKLCDDFSKYGIKLIRLNIETPKVLDDQISKQMAEISLQSTKIGVQESLNEKNYNIAKQQAEMNAKQKEIAQNQENENKKKQATVEADCIIAKAKAELDATRLRTEAKNLENEMEIKYQQMLLDLAERKAKQYAEFPTLLQYDLAKLSTDSMKNIEKLIISPEVAASLYMMNNFQGNLPQLPVIHKK